MRRSESFLFFSPGPFKGPRTRQGRGQTNFAAKMGNVSPHSRAHFEFCFRSLNSKTAFYHSNFLGQSLFIECDCAY